MASEVVTVSIPATFLGERGGVPLRRLVCGLNCKTKIARLSSAKDQGFAGDSVSDG